MTARKKPEDKQKTGRKSLYDPKFNRIVYELSLLKLDDTQMAAVLGVSVRTLDYWKIHHPAFLQAINDGKAPVDAKVAISQVKLAQGHHEMVEKPYVINGKVKIVKYREYFPPNATAGIFWLKNRQREHWRDVQRLENEHSGKDGGPIQTEAVQTVILDASKLDPEARALLRDALKAAKG